MDKAFAHINPQEITGWLQHVKNADFIRTVRDHCNQRLEQLGEPRDRARPKVDKATKPSGIPRASNFLRQVGVPQELSETISEASNAEQDAGIDNQQTQGRQRVQVDVTVRPESHPNATTTTVVSDLQTQITGAHGTSDAEMMASSMAEIMQICQDDAYEILLLTIGGKPWR